MNSKSQFLFNAVTSFLYTFLGSWLILWLCFLCYTSMSSIRSHDASYSVSTRGGILLEIMLTGTQTVSFIAQNSNSYATGYFRNIGLHRKTETTEAVHIIVPYSTLYINTVCVQ